MTPLVGFMARTLCGRGQTPNPAAARFEVTAWRGGSRPDDCGEEFGLWRRKGPARPGRGEISYAPSGVSTWGIFLGQSVPIFPHGHRCLTKGSAL
jgi:hypothetical protein